MKAFNLSLWKNLSHCQDNISFILITGWTQTFCRSMNSKRRSKPCLWYYVYPYCFRIDLKHICCFKGKKKSNNQRNNKPANYHWYSFYNGELEMQITLTISIETITLQYENWSYETNVKTVTSDEELLQYCNTGHFTSTLATITWPDKQLLGKYWNYKNLSLLQL